MDDLINRKKLLDDIKNMSFHATLPYPLKASIINEITSIIQKLLDSIIEIIKKSPSESVWIPCSERMPEHYNEILFCERDRTIHKGYMYWDGTFIENHVKFLKSDIVAWMPIPEQNEKE